MTRETENIVESPDHGRSAEQHIPLSTFGARWRLVASLVIFGILTAGQIVNTNDWFPLGSLSQYSYARPINGDVKAVRVRAINSEGNDVPVPLTKEGVGIGRAEVEGQLQRIIDNPKMLEGLARSWNALHPTQPSFKEIRMERVTRPLENGKATGESSVELLATWTVKGTYGEQQ